MFRFANEIWLYALLVVPVLILIFWMNARWRKSVLDKLGDAAILENLIPTFSKILPRWKRFFFLLGGFADGFLLFRTFNHGKMPRLMIGAIGCGAACQKCIFDGFARNGSVGKMPACTPDFQPLVSCLGLRNPFGIGIIGQVGIGYFVMWFHMQPHRAGIAGTKEPIVFLINTVVSNGCVC